MTTLYIFAGANGSGKTTTAKLLTQNWGITFINADEIANSIGPDFESAKIKAGKVFAIRCKNAIQAGKSFAIESTLSGKTILKAIDSAKKNGFKVWIIYLFLDHPNTNIERIKIRVKGGGHHIEDEDVIRRFHRSKRNFWNIYQPVSDQWILYCNMSNRLILVADGSKKMINIHDEILLTQFKNEANE